MRFLVRRQYFRNRFLHLCFLAALALLSASPSRCAAESAQTVIAIGDVHGNFDGLCDILKRVGLINDSHHWSGGQTALIQTGDLVDRGSKERDVLDMLILLEGEAAKAGGHLTILLGNHEVMNIMGDVRYVTPQIFSTFATPDSGALRKTSYEQFAKWQKENSAILSLVNDPQLSLTEQEWLEKHPVGFIEQRIAFSRSGVYGKWIRQHHAVEKFNSVVYLHGGIAPEQSRLTLDQMNSRIHDEIQLWDELFQYLVDRKLVLPFFTLAETTAVVKAVFAMGGQSDSTANEEQKQKLAPFLQLASWLCVSPDGPLWYRGYDEWSDQDGPTQVDALLHAYDAVAVVVAHTVQKTLSIRARFGGKVFLIDTGMVASASHAGRASALQIRDNAKFTAIYLDGETVLFEKGSAVPATAP